MLNSYSIYKGIDTTISENGSPEGVINAASINTTQTACLLNDFSVSLDNTPRADSATTTVGNSKTIPKINNSETIQNIDYKYQSLVNTIEVSKEMYEESENMFGTSALT